VSDFSTPGNDPVRRPWDRERPDTIAVVEIDARGEGAPGTARPYV